MAAEFDKDGYLFKRVGEKKDRRIGQRKWNYYYFNLIGGSLHYYEDADDEKPKGTIELGEVKLNKSDNEGSSKPFCFSLKNDKVDYLLAAEDEDDFNAWTSAIASNVGKAASPPLTKEKRKGRVAQLAARAKKNVVGKAATSALGKKAIKAKAPEEVIELIGAVRTIVAMEGKTPKKGAELEHDMFKIGVKTFLLLDAGKLKIDEILLADKPVRQALEILKRCHDACKFGLNKKIDTNVLRERFVQVNKLMVEAGSILTKLVEPHLTPKNVALIQQTITTLADPDMLVRVFMDSALDEELQALIDAAEHYTQFHFYPDEK